MRQKEIFVVLRDLEFDRWNAALGEFIESARREGQLYEPRIRLLQRLR